MRFIKVPIICLISMMTFGETKNTFQHALRKATSCSCTLDGSYYNLRSLGNEDRSQPALIARKDDYDYGYNPCFPFTLEGKCTNVVICRWAERDPNSYTALGRSDNVTCHHPSSNEDKNIKVHLVFHQPGKDPGWITTIKLKCNKTLEKPHFTIPNDDAIPVLQVEHKCCCPDMCPDFYPLPKRGHRIEGEVIGGAAGLLVLLCLIIFVWHKKCRNNRTGGQRHGGYGAVVHEPRHNRGRDDDDDGDRSEENDEDDDKYNTISQRFAAEHEDEQERPSSEPVQVVSGREDQHSCRSLSASSHPVEHPY